MSWLFRSTWHVTVLSFSCAFETLNPSTTCKVLCRPWHAEILLILAFFTGRALPLRRTGQANSLATGVFPDHTQNPCKYVSLATVCVTWHLAQAERRRKTNQHYNTSTHSLSVLRRKSLTLQTGYIQKCYFATKVLQKQIIKSTTRVLVSLDKNLSVREQSTGIQARKPGYKIRPTRVVRLFNTNNLEAAHRYDHTLLEEH